MHCQFSALADAANLSANGKLNILGEFDTLWFTGEPPVGLLTMVFVAKLQLGETDVGASKIQLRVVDLDEKLVALLLDGTMEFKENPNPGSETGIPVLVPVHGASFPRFDTYKFQLLINGEVVGHPPMLHVRQRVMPPPA